jgi:hypothetical protein
MTHIRTPVVTNSGLTMVSPVMSMCLLGTGCRHDLWWKPRNRSWGAQAWGPRCLGQLRLSNLWAAPHPEMLLQLGWCPIWLEEQMAGKVILQLWPLPLLQCVSILSTNNGTKIKTNALCSCILKCVQKTSACWNFILTLGFLLPQKHTISFLTDPFRWNLALLVKAVSDV